MVRIFEGVQANVRKPLGGHPGGRERGWLWHDCDCVVSLMGEKALTVI
jgi:hypothetical protein